MDPICIQNVSTRYTAEDVRKALTALFESDCIERVKAFPSGTRVFVAGPNDLVTSVRNCAEKFNIAADNINLNY